MKSLNQSKNYIFILLFISISIFSQESSNTINTSHNSSISSFGLNSYEYPSPDLIKLRKSGRFYERFRGNIKYLKYLYQHYRQEMIDAYKARNYSPGKLLERMWDGEYAGKWLDAAIRSGVNTGDNELLGMVDSMIQSLLKHQQTDGYMGIKPPTDRELTIWENTISYSI